MKHRHRIQRPARDTASRRRSRLAGPAAAVVAAMLTLSFASSPARADGPLDASTRASTASVLAPSVAGGVLVAGTLSALQLGGEAVVDERRDSGGRHDRRAPGRVGAASEATTASVRIAGQALVGVGTVVRVVAMSTGCALIAGGRTIAFVPNAAGQALLHRSRATALRGGDR